MTLLPPLSTKLPSITLKKYLLNTKVNFYSIFSYVTHCARVSWFWESLSLTSTDVDMKPREKKNISSRSSSVLPSHSCYHGKAFGVEKEKDFMTI